jgi:hypothetical protein
VGSIAGFVERLADARCSCVWLDNRKMSKKNEHAIKRAHQLRVVTVVRVVLKRWHVPRACVHPPVSRATTANGWRQCWPHVFAHGYGILQSVLTRLRVVHHMQTPCILTTSQRLSHHHASRCSHQCFKVSQCSLHPIHTLAQRRTPH